VTPYPGNYAVPGSMQPGTAVPGTPLSGGALRGVFEGPEETVYPSYIDLGAGHTLDAVPGDSYEIEQAGPGAPSASPGALPPDGKWIIEAP
jgi:hypothetical protein